MSEQGTPADPQSLAVFCRLIVEAGECFVEGHLNPAGVERRYIARGVFDNDLGVEIAHGPRITQVISFGTETSCHLHRVHTDGRAVTMHLADGTPWRTVRLPGSVTESIFDRIATQGATAREAAAAVEVPESVIVPLPNDAVIAAAPAPGGVPLPPPPAFPVTPPAPSGVPVPPPPSFPTTPPPGA